MSISDFKFCFISKNETFLYRPWLKYSFPLQYHLTWFSIVLVLPLIKNWLESLLLLWLTEVEILISVINLTNCSALIQIQHKNVFLFPLQLQMNCAFERSWSHQLEQHFFSPLEIVTFRYKLIARFPNPFTIQLVYRNEFKNVFYNFQGWILSL